MSVCSLSYPACKAHAPNYIVICDLSGSTTFFPHYLSNGRTFGLGGGGGIERKMGGLIFSANWVSNIPYFKKSLARYCHTCTYVYM
jgi:hypothetical protein